MGSYSDNSSDSTSLGFGGDNFSRHDGWTQSHNRQESHVIEVKNLTVEVDERGVEWFERVGNLQMPWEWCGKGNKSRRKILNDVSFKVKSGEMLAVLGSSGSGKTSLLDVLSLRTQQGDITGDVILNGKPRTEEDIQQCSAYVRQDDRLLPHLTVQETLSFVGQLRLPSSWSHSEIMNRVNSVIAELGLRHVANSRVGGVEVRGISGGERRRVSIGVQLLQDPSILFLDEPTSGLDSFTAHTLVETLSKLARNNRIVMLSIHQPRSDIFELFNLIMLMSRGDTVYFGKASSMVPYFASIGHPCPDLTNPCDHYVDLCTVNMKTEETEEETTEKVKEFVDAFNSRRSEETLTFEELDNSSMHIPATSPNHSLNRHTVAPPAYDNVAFVQDNASASDVNKNKMADMTQVNFSMSGQPPEADRNHDPHDRTSQDRPPIPGADPRHRGSSQGESIDDVAESFEHPSVRYYNNRHQRDQSNADGSESVESDRVSINTMPPTSTDPPKEKHELRKAGSFKQFWILLRRAMKNNLEDYSFLGVQAIEAIAMSLVLGLVFVNLGIGQTSIRDRFGLLYSIGALYPYMIILDVIGAYHRERNTLYHEMQDGLYTEGPYYFAKLLSELPEHTVFVILYSVAVYFMSGLQVEPGLYLQHFAVVYALVYCSRALALFSGAFMPTYQMSVLCAQTLFTIFLLSSGFIFNLENLFVGVKWTSYISYIKWGFQGLCVIEFTDLTFTCEEGMNPDNCVNTGEEALLMYSLHGYEVWQCLSIVLAEILVFLFLFFIALKCCTQRPHQH